MLEYIKVTTEGSVTTLTLARPEKMNAITQDMYGEMADAIAAYGVDDSVRAFVITGEGDYFTSGNDLRDFASGSESGELPPVARFLNTLRDCPKVLIASVNGHAIGVGLTMLLHCDLVYAAESCTFRAPFVELGLVPEAGSSRLLPAAVGMAVANDVLLSGRVLTAAEALNFGLIARTFPVGKLSENVSEIAVKVSSSAPDAMKHSKALIRHGRNDIANHMAVESDLFVKQLQSTEFAECISAMREKRVPVFP